MRKLLCLFLLVGFCSSSQTFTEFYCDATASANNTNINAGSTTGAPVYSKVNMNWDGTSVFTPNDGTITSTYVTNGAWAAIFYDGSTNLVQAGTMGGIIALVTNVAAGANGAITIDRATISGTVPSSSATGRSINVGGCWQGPYAGIPFPLGFISSVSTNANGLIPRINFKNSAKYVISAALVHSIIGPVVFQGYTSSPGDGGKFTVDGNGQTGNMLTFNSSSGRTIIDCIITNSASSGNGLGLTLSTIDLAYRCIVVGMRGNGFSSAGTTIQCEARDCGRNNISDNGGFALTGSGALADFCVSSNATTKASGYIIGNSATLKNSIGAFNGQHGVSITTAAAGGLNIINCCFYNNGICGVASESATAQCYLIKNCNFFKHTGYAVSNQYSLRNGLMLNCFVGSGSQANSAGTIYNIGGIITNNIFVYTADGLPWVDAPNGNFAITGLAKGVGLGSFIQSGLASPTISYPDIGAAQASDTNNAAQAGGSYTFAQ